MNGAWVDQDNAKGRRDHTLCIERARKLLFGDQAFGEENLPETHLSRGGPATRGFVDFCRHGVIFAAAGFGRNGIYPTTWVDCPGSTGLES